MEPWVDDLADDLQSLSFTSTSTTTTTINRSTSSGSGYGSSLAPSAHGSFSSKPIRSLSLSDIRFSLRLGSGDIGSVYLTEIKSTSTENNNGGQNKSDFKNCGILFAAKVMDKKELAARSKEERAKTEREILEQLDHPFLPSLYAAIDSPKWLCLLTEFCPGGDLHVLRQRQPFKRFAESAVRDTGSPSPVPPPGGMYGMGPTHLVAVTEGTELTEGLTTVDPLPCNQFYASEVVVALEYLHMLGIVYRDLKPENVLVRSDGHIMLTDFDLSLKCDDSISTPQLISDKNPPVAPPWSDYPMNQPRFTSSSCILPNCIVPAVSCFHPKRKRKKKTGNRCGPEFVAEPIDVRSMSFVGTHEYLAPEIVSGEGHGSPVDWWTLGIFIFELFYGFTPFKGVDNELTLANIVARALEFPKEPAIPAAAKDLISQLLVKDPTRRLGSIMGASAIRHHPFFQGVNWALLRCTSPPYVPPPFSREAVSGKSCQDTPVDYY